MLAWSPLLIRRIDIRALGFALRKLQLNRHRLAEVAPHAHPFAQLILYLDGEGVQVVRGRRVPARSGDLFLLPAHTPHGFAAVGHSRPLCLVLEFDGPRPLRRARHRRLPQSTLNELHALLARVPAKGRPALGDCPAILAVAARLLAPSARAGAEPAQPLFDRVRRELAAGAAPAAAARAAGYARDALTRRLRRQHGLGLRALRDRLRLEKAETALREGLPVAEVAARAGFDDPNYFARWFRRRTGSTPSAWRGTH